MPASLTFDLETLLGPIPGKDPAGESLRLSGVYDVIKEKRRSDDGLPKGEWQEQGKKKIADWPGVIATASEALTAKTKDLQIAVWLVEALVKCHGFAGLRDGLRLLRELHERYWESLYPRIEEGDLGFRAGPLEWLNKTLPLVIRMIPLTRSSGGRAYAFVDWDESRWVENLRRQSPDKLKAALDEGKLTGEQFDKAVATTSKEFYQGLLHDLAGCQDECRRLEKAVDEKFKEEAPSLSDIRHAIEDCTTRGREFLEKKEGSGKKGETMTTPIKEPASIAPIIDSQGNRVELATGVEPQDRADALRRLAAVAAYFRNTEPHSPVAYLVQRAIRWGEMPLENWLEEVIESEEVRQRVRDTLGIRKSNMPKDAETGTDTGQEA